MSHNIERLINLFARVPGMGPRSARRVVLYLIRYRETLMPSLADALRDVAKSITQCSVCGNLDETSPCAICISDSRDRSIICVVENIADLWAIERSNIFRSTYHILGGALSATQNKNPENLNIDKLLERAANDEVREVIIATNATMDGQTTAYYLMEKLKSCNVAVSRLAHGIPIGGELDYLDEGTLNAALNLRQPF